MADKDPVIEQPISNPAFKPEFRMPQDDATMQSNFEKSVAGLTNPTPLPKTLTSNTGQQVTQTGIGIPRSVTNLFGKGPTVTGPGVPSSGQQFQTDSTINDMMKSLNQPIPPEVIRAGTTPVPMGGTTQVPQSMMEPLAPFQPRPMDQRQVVGRHNARMQGISNAFTGMTNLIGTITRNEQQQQHQKIAVATQRLMESQDAINQAQMIVNSPTADAAAKANAQKTIDHNTDMMNRLLTDKGIRKGIEKGLDISFTDPSKNKTPDHAAVAAGRQNFAQQFGQQMPQRMAIDPMGQQRLSMAIQQKQADQKLLGQMLPRIIGAESAMQRTQLVQSMANLRLMSQQQQQAAMLAQNFAQKQALMGLGHQYKLDETYKSIAWAGQKAFELGQLKDLSPENIVKAKQEAVEKFATAENELRTQQAQILSDITKEQTNLGKMGKAGASAKENMAKLQDLLKDNKSAWTNLQTTKDSYFKEMQGLQEYGYKLSQGQTGMSAPTGGISAGPSSNIWAGSDESAGGVGQGLTYDPAAVQSGLPGIAIPSDETDADSNPYGEYPEN